MKILDGEPLRLYEYERTHIITPGITRRREFCNREKLILG